ncbi:MAG: hypothetical protein WC728_14640 [Elusimicrobiota bacterium]
MCSLALAQSCGDEAPSGGSDESYAGDGGGGGGGGTSSGGEGGQVRIEGDGTGSQETIADRYGKAMDLIKQRDWDGAREQLLEALYRSPGPEIQKDIREHLKIVERGILSQPAQNVNSVFRDAPNLYDKKVSIRGTFVPGGAVGKTMYYFFVSTGQKIQCRYGALSLDDKRTILLLDEGAQVMVRGTLKSPWGSNPNPYLEANYFRLEKASAKPAQPPAEKKEGEP